MCDFDLRRYAGACALFAVVTAIASCAALKSAPAVKDPTVAVSDAVCVFDTYSAERQAGIDAVQAGLDAAAKCGVARDVGLRLTTSAEASAERMNRASPPCDAGK